MFERFTAGGRRALVLTLEEARLLGHASLHREHLLLALLREAVADQGGVVARIFADGGAPVEELAALAADAAGRRDAGGAAGPTMGKGSQPFSAEAKKVLELSLREALQLGHNYIAEFHMLLAMIRAAEDPDDPAWSTLIANAGLQLARARHLAFEHAPATGRETRPARGRAGRVGRRRGTPGFDAVLKRAASFRPRHPTTTGDLLLALLDEADTHAWTVSKFLEMPSRDEIAEHLRGVESSGAPDGAKGPRVSVDRKTGAITIRDERITELVGRPAGSLSAEEARELDDRLERAFAEARQPGAAESRQPEPDDSSEDEPDD